MAAMLRVIFDTNIYGIIILENPEIVEKIVRDTDLVVYNFKPIRRELRDIPKKERIKELSKRNFALQIYDQITKNHYLSESIKIDKLALKFYNRYRAEGGIRDWKTTNIKIDFTIVACACLNSLDVIYSNDESTMISKPALKAYKHIAIKESLKVPNFWRYKDLKERYN